MLDAALRSYLGSPLKRAGAYLHAKGVSADAMALGAFALGLGAAFAVGFGAYHTAVALILANRLGEGLSSGIARGGRASDFAGYLGIVLDFIFFAAVVLAFAFNDTQSALVGAILIFALLGLGGTALGYAAVAAQRGYTEDIQATPLVDLMARLVEGTETTLVLIVMCLLPAYFAGIALLFAAACLATTVFRIVKARQVLR